MYTTYQLTLTYRLRLNYINIRMKLCEALLLHNAYLLILSLKWILMSL